MNVLHSIITSKARIKVLMRLFLNPAQPVYLRELADEVQLSPGQVGAELTQLKQADVVKTEKKGRSIYYTPNQKHPLFPELRSMVKKAAGVDQVVDRILSRLGSLEKALLIDDYAKGRDSGIIDLVLIGDIDQSALANLVAKTEKHIGRKIRTLCLSSDEYDQLRPKLDNRPHVILFAANS